MKRILLPIIIAICASLPAMASGKFEIKGKLANDSLRLSNATVKKVYLSKVENGHLVHIDSATVKRRKFKFKGIAPDVVERYFISGFDNGSVELFLEPGKIVIEPFNAKFPGGAKVKGTRNNDVLYAVKNMFEADHTSAVAKVKAVKNSLPEEIQNNEDLAYPYLNAQFNNNTAWSSFALFDLLLKHLDTEAALYLIYENIMNKIDSRYFENHVLQAIPFETRKHPVYKTMANKTKAANMKIGGEVPDVEAYTVDGQKLALSDLRGKYVLLDFWASWCGPCRREFPFLKEALKAAEGSDQFVIISVSLDDKKEKWVNAINSNGLDMDGWYHISELKGWHCEGAELFGVSAVPSTFLINPAGKLVATELRGKQLVTKIKNILLGIESYK